MTTPFTLRFASGGETVDLEIPVDLGGTPPPPNPSPIAGVFDPIYTLPVQVEYNATTKECDLKSEVETRLAYATNLPPSSVTLLNQGSTAANRALLVTALNNAYAGTGPRRIRLDNTGQWGEDHDLNRAMANGTHWLYIESVTIGAGTFPRAEGQRVSESDEASMAKFGIKTYNTMAFRFGPNTRRVRFVGLAITIDPDFVAAIRTGPYGLPSAGGGGGPFTYGMFGWDMNNVTVVDGVTIYSRQTGTPEDIILDRCSVRGDDDVMIVRNILAAMNRFAVLDCYLECAGAPFTGQDCQNISVTSCAGDIIVRNNTLACAWGEHIMFGGGPTYAEEYLPADSVIVDNLFTFLPRWRPGAQDRWHKNHFELKYGVRVLFERNMVEHYYGYGRFGNQFWVLIIKTTDQFSNENWIKTRDVTARLNWCREVSGSFALVGRDPSVGDMTSTHRVEIAHNVFLPHATPPIAGQFSKNIQLSAGPVSTSTNPDPEWALPRDIDIRYNSIGNADNAADLYNVAIAILYDSPRSPRSTLLRHRINNNVFAAKHINSLGWFMVSDSAGSPGGALTGMPSAWTNLTRVNSEARGNVFAGVSDVAAQLHGAIGTTNKGAATLAGLNLNATTLKPLAGSIVINASTDGINSGADTDFVAAVTARSVTGRD
jgi:hypothetical protein